MSGQRGDQATRRRVLDAAVACILEEGFYRASSNAIARRADVTWGVIQHHFGTREGLLVAVFEDACRELVDTYRDARIEGDTTAERIRSYFELLRSFYGKPSYLAYLQIQLNLVHSPTTSDDTVAALRRLQAEVAPLQRRVLAEVVPEPHQLFVFQALRGFVTYHLVEVDVLSTIGAGGEETFERRAGELVAALAAHVDRASR